MCQLECRFPRVSLKKIVLLLDSDPGYGGTFQYSLSLLEAVCRLRAEKMEVSVLYTHELWEGHIPQGVRKIRLRFGKIHKRFIQASLNMGVPSAFIRRKIEVACLPARQVIGEHADLYITPSQDSVWSYAVEIPSLAVVHDLMHRYERRFPEVSRYGRYRVREMHLRNTCKYAKGILVDSEIGKKQVCESYNVPPERVFELPYIPPKYIYEKTGKEDQTFAERYSLPPKFFFYPAQFWEHKNHVRLFKALKSLERELPDLQLLLAGGKKNGYKESRRRVESLGLGERVHFLGYVPNEDLPGFYKRARGLIMPTFFGPTNIPPLEAFAMGCPVAASNVYGMPDQIGDAGLLFDPMDEDGITEAMRRLWVDDELCTEFALKGLERANRWGVKEFSRKLGQIINLLIGS